MGEVGRLFLFLAVVILITIFMIIVNVQDHADQIQQKAADLQQITQGDVLIHHTDHLPSVRMSSGSRNKPPTVIGMPSAFYYITLRKKCQTIVSVVFCKNKNDLTNRRKSLIIKVKRAHQQTVCSHCIS